MLVENGADGELPDVRPATVLLLSRAAFRHERGDLSAALADLDRARTRLDRFGASSWWASTAASATALVKHALGDEEAARREAGTALAAARGWGTAGAVGTALRACGLVAERRERIELLRRGGDRARGLCRGSSSTPARSSTSGRRCGARGNGSPPASRCGAALDLAQECGGLAVAERAREELAATGVRVRRDAQSGVDSLTPSERRIVERAAAGASNREIAQALFVTVKTVEMHLGHAYRKLGISSRNELAALIRQ